MCISFIHSMYAQKMETPKNNNQLTHVQKSAKSAQLEQKLSWNELSLFLRVTEYTEPDATRVVTDAPAVADFSLSITLQTTTHIPINIVHSQSMFCSITILHRVSKKLCQLIFCSLSVKYEPISIKIARIVPEETLNKTVPKMPTSPKVCTCTTFGNLKCQIELSTQ